MVLARQVFGSLGFLGGRFFFAVQRLLIFPSQINRYHHITNDFVMRTGKEREETRKRPCEKLMLTKDSWPNNDRFDICGSQDAKKKNLPKADA